MAQNFSIKDAVETREFKDLADYGLVCLSVPVSYATVELLFSMVSFTKTKTRNQMKPVLLKSIQYIRSQLYFAKKCCVDFVLLKQGGQLAAHAPRVAHWTVSDGPL